MINLNFVPPSRNGAAKLRLFNELKRCPIFFSRDV